MDKLNVLKLRLRKRVNHKIGLIPSSTPVHMLYNPLKTIKDKACEVLLHCLPFEENNQADLML